MNNVRNHWANFNTGGEKITCGGIRNCGVATAIMTPKVWECAQLNFSLTVNKHTDCSATTW